MDQDCSAGISLGLAISDGTASREKDEMYVSKKKVNGPPLQLDLFPLDRDSGRCNFPGRSPPITIDCEDGMMARSWRMTEFGRRYSAMQEEEGCSREKLRLSREQCAVLEESFRKNRVPEPKEKQALALQLNLRPRQVEVWFQNRRASTKLKKIKVDCEGLKIYNEALADENRKLRIKLEKLKALKLSSPPLRPASALTMCPSCERVSAADNSSHLTLAKSGSMFLGHG